MNECTPYVVLRNARAVADEAAKALHGDIDLLVANRNEFAAFAGAVKVKSKANHGAYLINVGRRPVKLDVRTPGDGYYDEKWAREIVATRVLRDGLYVPSDDQGRWSLLYHALAHKREMPPDYAQFFARFGALDDVKAQRSARLNNIIAAALSKPPYQGIGAIAPLLGHPLRGLASSGGYPTGGIYD